MKINHLAVVLIIGFATSSAFASDDNKSGAKETKVSATATKEKGKTKKTVAAKKQEVALTGSSIKREVRSDGQVTDAPNSLAIIDRKAIERSGAADVRQVLARQSAFR